MYSTKSIKTLAAALLLAACSHSEPAPDTDFRQPETVSLAVYLECGRLPQVDPDRQPELWAAVREKAQECAFEEYVRRQEAVWAADPTAGVVLEPEE